jgi:hypothetical protein
MAYTTLSTIYTAARAAAAVVEVGIYIGRLADYDTKGGVAAGIDPVLVLEFPTGSDAPLAGGNAIKTNYNIRGYMLTADSPDSTADAVLEPSDVITPRQTSLEAMDALMTAYVFAFRAEIMAAGGEFTAANNAQSLERFTVNTMVGIGRTFGAAVVNVAC